MNLIHNNNAISDIINFSKFQILNSILITREIYKIITNVYKNSDRYNRRHTLETPQLICSD